MNIESLPPVGADPPAAQAPTASPAGGPSFGQFLDTASAAQPPDAAAPPRAQSPAGPQTTPAEANAGSTGGTAGVSSSRPGNRAKGQGNDTAQATTAGTLPPAPLVVPAPAFAPQAAPTAGVAADQTAINGALNSVGPGGNAQFGAGLAQLGQEVGASALAQAAGGQGVSTLPAPPASATAASTPPLGTASALPSLIAALAAGPGDDPSRSAKDIAGTPAPFDAAKAGPAMPPSSSGSTTTAGAKLAAAVVPSSATPGPATAASSPAPAGAAANSGAAANGSIGSAVSAQAASLLGRVTSAPEPQPQSSSQTPTSTAGAAVPTDPAGLTGPSPVALQTVGNPNLPNGTSAANGPEPALPMAPALSGSVDLLGKLPANAALASQTHPGSPASAPAPAGSKSADAKLAGPASGTAQADHSPEAQAPAEVSGAILSDKQAAEVVQASVGPTDPATRDQAATAAPDATAATTTITATMQPVPPLPVAPNTPVAENAASVAAALHPASEQLAVNLKRAAKDGDGQIQIELTPPSLGKIEVRLDFGHDGRLNAVISADRADTLHLLSNDSKALEQSLRDAGLRTDSSSLTFNLRGDGSNSGQRHFAQSNGYSSRSVSAMQEDAPIGSVGAISAASSRRYHDGNLDIHV